MIGSKVAFLFAASLVGLPMAFSRGFDWADLRKSWAQYDKDMSRYNHKLEQWSDDGRRGPAPLPPMPPQTRW